MQTEIIKALMGAAGAVGDATYVDDIFSTYLWRGDGNSGRTITNNIDVSGEGALVWMKSRSTGHVNVLFDTERGANQRLRSDSNLVQNNTDTLQPSFTSSGFTVGSGNEVNGSGNDYSSWTFRKAPGFFDIVTYTGTGSSVLTLSHDLGSVPGMILIKRLDGSNSDWIVYHHSTGITKYLKFNTAAAAADDTNDYLFNDVAPTSTHFTIGAGHDAVNANTNNYVAYLFAGGESTAATARSVDFDGSGDTLQIAQHADLGFGTGDYTVEFWIKFRNLTTQVAQVDLTGSTTADMWQIYNTTDGKIHLYRKVGGSGSTILSSESLSSSANGGGQWFHIAVTRASNTTRLYVNGTTVATTTDTTNYPAATFTIANKKDLNLTDCNCQVSNVRIVKGTAVYTSSFRPPTEPLTNITNTKLLCCNGSSPTSSTVTPGTITANGNPTASIDSPFVDASSLVFGEDSDQEIIKCGSYVGNGSSTGPEINLGWEPQWILLKNTASEENWFLWDSMRGIATGGYDSQLHPNTNGQENSSHNRIDLTSTGFKVVSNDGSLNESGATIIYTCLRRSDGYVGKPPELGTDVFAIDTGAGSTTIPNFDSGFPVDYTFMKKPASNSDWYTYARLTQKFELVLNTNAAQGGASNYTFDSNVGWGKGGDSSVWQSFMWKRHKGFDVVAYKGTGSNRTINHSMNVAPTMMWVKRRNSDRYWGVYHSGLGDNRFLLKLNENVDYQNDQAAWNNTAPTSTVFSVGTSTTTNASGDDYIAMLFASVDGISKVGSYSGSGSSRTITTGFQPRFLFIKSTSNNRNWQVLDTTRGWGSGNDNRLWFDLETGQSGAFDVGAPTSTGFTIADGNNKWNASGENYIYYAHA